jgi:hypothetical protein
MNSRARVVFMNVAVVMSCWLWGGMPSYAQAIIADHNAVGEFPLIPGPVIEAIGDNYDIYYVHTSHGSQIMTGISQVYDEDNFYDPPVFHEVGDDLGHNGDLTWVPATRAYLDAHPECTMAMFSWCGGVSDNTEEGINIYLEAMETLEADYPGVVFIYMTGHLDGTGPEGNLYIRNNQIREYCAAHDKILFDFADIESYDPGGIWYPYETDACGWCETWCAAHAEFGCTCGECAHSHCFNCYQKGKAWWWMMARVSGWTSSGCNCGAKGDMDGSGTANPVDVAYLVNYVYKSLDALVDPPNCAFPAGDVDCGGQITPLDVAFLVKLVYTSQDALCSGCNPPPR